ncbi:thymidine kinase [Microbacterium jejuense]|uniref:Thymidine kinase n=1 Tax=Microbacterium jejuense TaxID=1263637 RepID=A0ABS7HGZ4_9MICO|nr:thymidine kinase [Microbacterium jejuense]MBW9092191.1 thymidine kinase [Microbacterium jejuense]
MHTPDRARLQVVTGPMFAGKSEELLRRVRRARIAGLSVELVNHALDDRRGTGEVSSHSGLRVPSLTVADADALAAATLGRDLDIVAIDEAQFFGPALVAAAERLVADGVTVIVAGLCVTFDGQPFEPLPALMATAEDVLKLTAVCAVCGADAAFHQRIAAGDVADARVPSPEQVGGVESYQARCRRHFEGATLSTR